MVKKLIIYFLVLLIFNYSFSQEKTRNCPATRLLTSPKIDGKLTDDCWKQAQPVSDFTMYVPVNNVKPKQKTAVRICYDNRAIYIGAMMYDTAPDSIMTELGNRDDELNADFFEIEFDTYNMLSDAYYFKVYASGVQCDYRDNDYTFNSVWESAVFISDSGWAVEIKIPYSAIRFPKLSQQTWGMQIARSIRRSREHDYWAPEPRGASNRYIYWGKLTEINDIKAPLRLSVTPYVSVYGDHFTYNTPGKSNFSYAYSGGLDLKYGINESYTLDMTLLPDFSQVQSDNLVKNISPFETVYNENRPFFNEAVDLFEKGDIFYSRRIGRTPMGYYSVSDSMNEKDELLKNPQQAKLINAFKISGRNKNGTALGVLNAVTGNMYAQIEDSNGEKRKVFTEPLTNYNVLVYDQTLKNSSDIFITNTNVIRDRKFNDANVTAAGFSLNDKTVTYNFSLSGALSQVFEKNDSLGSIMQDELGSKYRVSFSKVKGNFRFAVMRNLMDNHFNANDLGLTLYNNEIENYGEFAYRIFEPFSIFRDMSATLMIDHTQNYLTNDFSNLDLKIQNSGTTKKYLTFWEGFGVGPFDGRNFYEPRTPGRFYRTTAYYYAYLGFSSDYRKKFSLDGEFLYAGDFHTEYHQYETSLTPIFRLSDKFTFSLTSSYKLNSNDFGFADKPSEDTVIFGKRILMTLENTLSGRYIFKNDLSLSLRLRHYWSRAQYVNFYTLLEDGDLLDNAAYYGSKDYDFNYNAFNVDLVFSWQFAPGSNLSIVWKNAILDEQSQPILNFFNDIKHTFTADQLNSLSIKVLYYLDYQYLVRNKKKG